MVLCGESEGNLKVMVGRFVEVYRRRGLKFNAGKSEVMVFVLGGEEGLVCEALVDGTLLVVSGSWLIPKFAT